MKMIHDAINMLVVATPLPYTGGGGYRALLSLKEYKKRGINPFLVLPWSFQFKARERIRKDLGFLLKDGVDLSGCAIPPKFLYHNFPTRRAISNLILSQFPSLIKIAIKGRSSHEFQCVMSMHEGVDAITTALRVGEIFSLEKIMVLLQLPPFYGDKRRIKNLERANHLWLELTKTNPLRRPWMALNRKVSESVIKNVKRLLGRFDLILAVSRAIPIEMGERWIYRIVSLDPGVALSQNDMQLISEVSIKTHRKEKIVIFGGRPDPHKGVIDALLAWKRILKGMNQNYKLIVTGDVQPNILARLKLFCRRINIEDKVLFTGFIPREERLSLVAKAKMMLYPSHADAFPYAVLEALHLNTPVVAYDIPALKIYYSSLEGVTLVKESDIESLAQKSIEYIESKNIHVEKPILAKNWDKIMDEETEIIKKHIL
jgi:glycosyltransferase involved in cell wall biosynthesis